jgi:hypothetical protein
MEMTTARRGGSMPPHPGGDEDQTGEGGRERAEAQGAQRMEGGGKIKAWRGRLN